MKNWSKLLIYVLSLIFFFSCKAYRNVENLKPKSSKEVQAGSFDRNSLVKLVPGDRITVNATTGFKYYMVYQNYTGDKLIGSVWKVNDEKLEIPQKTEIPFEEIDQVRVRRVSAAATVPVIVILTTIIVVPIAYVLSGGIYIGF